METQTIQQKIMNAEQEIVQAQKELARLQVHKKMADKFQKLMATSDLETRYQAAQAYTCGTGPVLEMDKLIFEIDPVASLLHRCQLDYVIDDRERYGLATTYLCDIASRKMNEETYNSILNGTVAELGEHIQTIIHPQKPTLLERILGRKNN